MKNSVIYNSVIMFLNFQQRSKYFQCFVSGEKKVNDLINGTNDLMYLKKDDDTKLGEEKTGVESERSEGRDKYNQDTL